jgi:succinate dehydrogenase flavin-adding protein (antitoxin of CptAB toxin-antitoxin module)
MKYAFIKEHREEFPIDIMCSILEVSSSGFYAWISRDKEAKEARRNSLVATISNIYNGGRKSYGSPRVFPGS